MRMMHRGISLALALLMTVSLAACGGGSADDSQTTNTAESSATAPANSDEQSTAPEGKNIDLTMSFWAQQDEIDSIDQLLDSWKAENPGVNLDYTYCSGPDYPSKLQVWFSSSQVPDVIRMSRDIFDPFLEQGVFADLTPYVDELGLRDKWESSLLDIFTHNGELLSLPYLYDIYTFAYNKDIFDEAGVDYPTADWTEEEFAALCEQLTSGEGPGKIYVLWMGGWVCEIIRALYGEPKMYDVPNRTMNAAGNEKFRDAFQLFGDIHKNGWCSNEVTKTTTTGGFVTGKYAMSITMTGDISSYQKMIGDSFSWDIVEFPNSSKYNTRWNANIRLQGFGMSKTTANPDVAFDLVRFMTSDYEAQRNASLVGIPALNEYIGSDEFLTDYGNGAAYNKQAFVNMSEVAQSWEFAGIWADINDTLTSEFNAYITGAQDLDASIQNLQTKGEAVLAK